MRIDIRVELLPNGYWEAIDNERYECDGDSEGYYPNHARGSGLTKWDAIRELIDSLEDRDE